MTRVATGVAAREAPLRVERLDPAQTPNADPSVAGLVRPVVRRARTRKRWQTFLIRCIGPVGLLLFWWAGSATGLISAQVLAGPSKVWETTQELWSSGQLPDAITASLTRVGQGLFFGVSVGLLLGIAAGLATLTEELVDPIMQMLRTVPFLALVPLFIVWFGIDETPKIVLIAVAVAFPVYLNVYGGVRSVDRKVVEAARSFGVKGVRLTREIVLPQALPQILVGFRYAIGVSLVALIAAEQVNASAGLGFLLNQAREFMRTDILMVCIVVYALLGLAADLLVRLLERVLVPWRRNVAVR
jgi:sulfonate transport system permease protein